MNVKIVDILEKILSGYKIVAQVDNNEFISEWNGDKPEINRSYDVEIDIDDELKWSSNISLSNEDSNLIIQNNNYIRIVAKLDYNYADNLATLNLYDSIVIIDVEGIEQDISNKWVEMQCSSIKLFNTNL
jgi:hypothetical protein